MITTRTLKKSESLPEGFNTGYENMPIMHDWVWVCEENGEPCGVLLAAPCHGLVYMMRVCIQEQAGAWILAFLLRACMKDCEARGFKGYFTHLSTQTQVERQMIPICRKAGGLQLPIPQIVICGPIAKAARL